jgi:peptidoglycan/LPS O-acetylase OafA/YrhL
VIVLAALVIGPAITIVGRRSYLANPAVWGYIGHNLTMSPITLDLPGVFLSNPYTAVNGSIWTLPYEVLCYLAFVVAGVCRLLRPSVLAAGFVGALALYRVSVGADLIGLPGEHNGIFGLYVVAFGVWFLAGMLIAQVRHLVVGRPAVGLAALAVAGIGRVFAEPVLIIPALAVAIIVAGTLAVPAAARVRRWGDPSYGMYVWAFVIQQLVVQALAPAANPWVVAGVSSIVAVAVGYASWHLIEARAVRLSHRLTRRPQPGAVIDLDTGPAPASVPAAGLVAAVDAVADAALPA